MSKLPKDFVRFAGLLCAFLAGFTGCGPVNSFSGDRVSSIQQVSRRASRNANFGVRARIRGVVTFADKLAADYIIQDETAGIRAVLRTAQPLEAGQLVESQGVVQVAGATPILLEAQAKVLGTGDLPAPRHISFESPDRTSDRELASLVERRVSFRGVVETVRQIRPGVEAVSLRSAGAHIIVRAQNWTRTDNSTLVDAEVEIAGVLVRLGKIGDYLEDYRIWVPNLEAIRVLKPAPPLDSLPVSLVRAVAAHPVPSHRIHVRGTLTSSSAGMMRIRDASGEISLLSRGDLGLKTGMAADLVGFGRWENDEFFLDNIGLFHFADPLLREITTASALHRLPARIAATRIPIRIKGVVTFLSPSQKMAFVQDATDATYIRLLPGCPPAIREGDLVLASGFSTAGDFAPAITRGTLRKIGRGTFPTPVADIERAFTGYADSRWAEFRGVLQDVKPEKYDLLLYLTWGTHEYTVHLKAPLESVLPFVDRTVSIQGVLGTIFNNNRQFLGVHLYSPGIRFLRPLDSAPPNRSGAQPQSIASLLQFSSDSDTGHRVHVEGVVTFASESGPTWIRDNTGGLLIGEHNPLPLVPGDLVDVTGFPQAGTFSPVLKGATIVKLRSGLKVLPIQILPDDALGGSFDSQLVEMEGAIVGSSIVQADRVITVQSGPYLFDTRLALSRETPDSPDVAKLIPGAKVRVTGICKVVVDRSLEWLVPNSFELVLRSSGDLRIKKEAPWMTSGRLGLILAIALLVVFVAAGWILVLRRSVRLQTSKLSAALDGTRLAQSMQQDRKAILELIAKDEELARIIRVISDVTAKHLPGTACSIQIELRSGARIGVSSGVPEWLARKLDALALPSIFETPTPEPLERLSAAQDWPAAPHGGFGSKPFYCASPISLESEPIGFLLTLSDAHEVGPDTAEIVQSSCQLATLAVERRELYDQLSYRAQYDNMTALLNRAALYEALQREIDRSIRLASRVGVIYIDLDGFKSVNDRFGHDMGDLVLREVSSRVRSVVRHSDICARVGGDEFVIVLPNLREREEAERIGAALAHAIRQPIAFRGQALSVGASFGISVCPEDGVEPEAVLKIADESMYRRKRNARSHELVEA